MLGRRCRVGGSGSQAVVGVRRRVWWSLEWTGTHDTRDLLDLKQNGFALPRTCDFLGGQKPLQRKGDVWQAREYAPFRTSVPFDFWHLDAFPCFWFLYLTSHHCIPLGHLNLNSKWVLLQFISQACTLNPHIFLKFSRILTK